MLTGDENEEISQDKGSDSTTDREALFVLMQIDDQEKRLLLQRADDKGQQYYYQYDDFTKVYDKYKKIKEAKSVKYSFCSDIKNRPKLKIIKSTEKAIEYMSNILKLDHLYFFEKKKIGGRSFHRRGGSGNGKQNPSPQNTVRANRRHRPTHYGRIQGNGGKV